MSGSMDVVIAGGVESMTRVPMGLPVILPEKNGLGHYRGERLKERYGIDPQLVTALIHVESRFQPHARSPKGAVGLMQIMPATAARYGVTNPRSLLNPSVNIDVGTRYLRDLHDLFPGRVDLVLAAYNAGEGAVIKRGHRIPPFPETQSYVRNILRMLGLSI